MVYFIRDANPSLTSNEIPSFSLHDSTTFARWVFLLGDTPRAAGGMRPLSNVVDVSAAVAGGQVLAVARVADVSDGARLRERLLRRERVAAG